MIDFFIEFFSHNFMVYALIIGLTLGLGASLISPFLVLNRQSMIADGLSHVAFTGIIFGLLAMPEQPIWVALPIAVLASILITYLGEQKMSEPDSAIGVVSSFSLAIGLIIVSVAREGFNNDIESLLVGSILSASLNDVILSVITLFVIIAFLLSFYRKLLSSSYDPIYAEFSKSKPRLLKYLLSILTAVFIVLGVRTVGMLLISSFIIFPALIASQLSKSFKQNIFIGAIFSVLVVTAGTFLSFYLNFPTGSTIVVCYSFLLFYSILHRKLFKTT